MICGTFQGLRLIVIFFVIIIHYDICFGFAATNVKWPMNIFGDGSRNLVHDYLHNAWLPFGKKPKEFKTIQPIKRH